MRASEAPPRPCPPPRTTSLTLPVMDVASGELCVVQSVDEKVSSRPRHDTVRKDAQKAGECRCGYAAMSAASPVARASASVMGPAMSAFRYTMPKADVFVDVLNCFCCGRGKGRGKETGAALALLPVVPRPSATRRRSC